MTSNHHKDEVFRQKRIVKNPIKFKIPLNEEQKAAKEKILNNTLTVLAGKAGSGKTFFVVMSRPHAHIYRKKTCLEGNFFFL